MMPEISFKAKRYIASPIRRITGMLETASFKHEIISFGGGAPSLAPPMAALRPFVKALMKDPQNVSAYCSTAGLPKTRELITDMLQREEKINIGPDQIGLTTGGTEALYVTLLTLLNPGDEIITCNPSYLGYREPIKLVGAHEHMITVKWSEDFQIQEGRLANAVNKRTKAILLASPDNPTGAVQGKAAMKSVLKIAEENDLWVITDDIYKDMMFDGKFVNSRHYGGAERTITCCSFSKTASLPGFRSGYYYGPEKIVNKLNELKQSTSLASQKPVQYILQAFLENKARIKKEYVDKLVFPTYCQRRDVMKAAIEEYLPKAHFAMPQGAFYFFPDMSAYMGDRDDVKFCDQLFQKKCVVAIPGQYFGSRGREHVRLTFVSEPKERIEEGIRKIGEFVKK